MAELGRAGGPPEVIYFWQGADSSVWERGAAAILALDLDTKQGGAAKQVHTTFS